MMTIEPDGNATEEHPSHDRSALRYSNPTTDPEIPTERLTPSGTFSYRRGTPRTPSCGVKSSVPCRTRRLSCRVELNRTERQLGHRRGKARTLDSQKAKAPVMTPLAMALGKSTCASWVNGVSRMKNKVGGMTSRSLRGRGRGRENEHRRGERQRRGSGVRLTCPWAGNDESRAIRNAT